MLQINNVVKYFSSQKAVDDISFTVEQGKIFGLLGPNGAGKSTLLRMITGITYPDSGEIMFAGKKFDPNIDNAKIGYMPEERGLYKKMKAGEQALYLAQLKGMDRKDAVEKIKTWFAKMEMETWWDKKVEDLSKGMGQKLQFVTTVLHNPKLLILDEPFSGLDPVNANIIKEQIFDLAANGTTIIFSTHRMEQVEEICNKIVLVNQGKNILEGDVNEIKQTYKTNTYLLKTEGGNIAENDIFTILQSNNNKTTIQLAPNKKPNDVLQYCINNNLQVVEFVEQLPTLNDIFIHLVENKAVRQFVN